jgi:transposase
MAQSLASSPSRWMRNRDCKPSPIPLRICPLSPASIQRSDAITNTSDWALARSLAALDLHDGHVTARVERRHRSREFIDLLKDLDTRYPADCTIRLVLDNHSAHISKETRTFLDTRPNRFQYVLTPKHGSWLNIVETLFGKMARTFLRHIRVQSWAELRQRILQGIAEINAAPVVHRWRKFDALKPADQETI